MFTGSPLPEWRPPARWIASRLIPLIAGDPDRLVSSLLSVVVVPRMAYGIPQAVGRHFAAIWPNLGRAGFADDRQTTSWHSRYMSRLRELTFRVANSLLIRGLTWLHRRFAIVATYRVGRDGCAASFEGSWFSYNPRHFGCTGNIDYAPDAENTTRRALFGRIAGGQVFYDIGAHGGVYTITLRRRFPDLVVHSFEAQPEALLVNLRLNGMPIDHVHAVAVGPEPGTVRMTSSRRSSNHVSATGDRAVRMVRLDDYVREYDLPPPDWIKIDIEGFELPALRGAERLLLEARPTVICEINHLFGRFGTTIPELLGYMGSLGYAVHRLVDDRLERVSDASGLEELGHSADRNFWFVHGDAAAVNDAPDSAHHQ